ncbi:MAG TPA: P63C domain-containing protein [Bryobacteraceae bacterium]|jgi:hypothetical protein|nr:P63C domain-containing protein [Bryobacteraceae bacterium]
MDKETPEIVPIEIMVSDTIEVTDSIELSGRQRAGRARMKKLSMEERKELARGAAKARWGKHRASMRGPGEVSTSDAPKTDPIVLQANTLPVARWPGEIEIGQSKIACYVLDDGRRVISRGAATAFLTDGTGGGNLEQYLEVEALRPYMPTEWASQFIEFDHPQVVNRVVKGITAETFIEICQAFVTAWERGELTTDRQRELAMKAAIFMSACAKVGLIALIDEATGYQYDRPVDALQFKLKLFLLEEMRKWEKTFPDELWGQFGRLTNWKGSINSRPKYWGKLVMELIYEYLDPDVAQWLKENAPEPIGKKSYHRWLTEQYGLKKLVEHIYKVIGIASTCDTMDELRKEMQRVMGKKPGFQFELKLIGSSPEPPE